MDLVSRFGRAPLVMVAFQLLVLLGVLAYGLWPPSLGAHVVLPGLAMVAIFGGMIWLTLTRLWEPTPIKVDPPGGGIARYLWDQGLIVGVTLYVAHLYRSTFESAKDVLREIAADGETHGVREMLAQIHTMEKAQAWAADPWGAGMLSEGGGIVLLFVPAVFLLILWFFLPR